MKTRLHKNKAIIKSATISPYPHLRMGTNLNGKGKKVKNPISHASISIRGNLLVRFLSGLSIGQLPQRIRKY